MLVLCDRVFEEIGKHGDIDGKYSDLDDRCLANDLVDFEWNRCTDDTYY